MNCLSFVHTPLHFQKTLTNNSLISSPRSNILIRRRCKPPPTRCALHISSPETHPPSHYPQPTCHSFPSHPSWQFIGPPLSQGPLPAIIYLALTSTQSLQLPPFNHPAVHALSQSAKHSTPLRILSVNLPFHGTMPENEQALQKWATLYASGADPVSNFIRRVSQALDDLVDAGYVSPNSAVVTGLSRGALLAALLAAKNRHVRACVGFAPVTVLADLDEFHQIREKASSKLARASLMDPVVMKALLRMPLRFYMGNLDRRVGTRNAFEVVHQLAEQASKMEGVRSPPHEFVMYCSIGKDGHGTPPDVFEAGAEYAVSQIKDIFVERNN